MITKAEHVAIIVTDLEASISYYGDMFGYKLRLKGENPTRRMGFLYHDNQPGFEIELIQDREPQGDYSAKGIVNHLAFTVDNIEEAIDYYRKKGIQFNSEQPNPAPGGGKTIFFYGPDRELLQFVQRNKEALVEG